MPWAANHRIEAVDSHNVHIYDRLNEGDLVKFRRGLYSHWAVCVGDGLLVHLTGENDGMGQWWNPSVSVPASTGAMLDKANVRIDDFWDVVGEGKAYIDNSKDRRFMPLPRDQIVERALSRLGSLGYNVIWNNCEHFVAWCRYGVEWSDQAQAFLKVVGLAAAVASGVGILYAVTRKTLLGKRSGHRALRQRGEPPARRTREEEETAEILSNTI